MLEKNEHSQICFNRFVKPRAYLPYNRFGPRPCRHYLARVGYLPQLCPSGSVDWHIDPVFPGLPNQKPEAYFVLQMNPPACVDADPTAPTEMPGMRNIRGIQLLLVPEHVRHQRS